jgi:hypothetical protein
MDDWTNCGASHKTLLHHSNIIHMRAGISWFEGLKMWCKGYGRKQFGCVDICASLSLCLERQEAAMVLPTPRGFSLT